MRFVLRPLIVSGLVLAWLASSACVSLADRTDQTAVNVEDTGQYVVVSTQMPEPDLLLARIKVEHLASADAIARDYVHQKVSLGVRRVRIDVLGWSDKDDAPPRRQLRWPEDIDYSLDE